MVASPLVYARSGASQAKANSGPSGQSVQIQNYRLNLTPGRVTAAQPLDGANLYLNCVSKRAIDVTVAVLLLFGLMPLLLSIAAVVKATSRGPVLFSQRRNGAFGVPFTVYKFRSMTQSSCVETAEMLKQATRNDVRVTPVGRFMRRTSIDELPQLFNVLLGEMSLIGPRPHAMCHDDFYAAQIPTYARRFAARPGLSGLAQVRGARGETPQLSDMQRRVALDLEYIETASLRRDVLLLAETAKEMLFSKHAC